MDHIRIAGKPFLSIYWHHFLKRSAGDFTDSDNQLYSQFIGVMKLKKNSISPAKKLNIKYFLPHYKAIKP